MSKRHKKRPLPAPPVTANQSPCPPSASGGRRLAIAAVVVVLGVAVAVIARRNPGPAPATQDSAKVAPPATNAAAPSIPAAAPAPPDPPPSLLGGTMEVNTAMMVTVELYFGPEVPGIAEALQQIERRYKPDDGAGRTFAILDAYGGPTSDGQKLHLSMHVSAEKPGDAALIFRKTGEVLWQAKIVATTNKPSFTGKDLTILLDDGKGKTFLVDGSAGPPTILDATFRDLPGLLVRDFWPEGAEREVTFIYSACGCPVKAMVRRVSERTERTKEMPVMFPDDPPVMQVIRRLMAW
jgi:hypothetical protein